MKSVRNCGINLKESKWTYHTKTKVDRGMDLENSVTPNRPRTKNERCNVREFWSAMQPLKFSFCGFL